MKNNIKKIDNKTVRLIVMLLVGVNTIATMYGYNLIPFTDEEISLGISAVAVVVSEVWNHFKNNNYTKNAKRAQVYLDTIKGGKK
jgi:SPP1 family holin